MSFESYSAVGLYLAVGWAVKAGYLFRRTLRELGSSHAALLT